MRRAPLCLYSLLGIALFACGARSSKSKSPVADAETKRGKDDLAPAIAARLHMSLEFAAVPREEPPQSQISLVETNEMGSNTRHNLGVFDGECKDVTVDVRATEPEVFLAFHCQPFAEQRGVLVHLLKRRGRIVLLRAWLGASKPTFDEFDQIGELPPYRSGVPVVSDYDTATE